MYKITAKFPSGDDLVLYDPAGTGALPILGPKQTEELNQPGSLTFTLLYPHGAYGLLDGMKVYISAEKEGEEIFYGRVLDVEPDELAGQEAVTCEGALSFLNDGFLAPDPKNSSGTTQSQTMTAEAFLNRCIDEYNDDIDNDPRRVFHVGNVTVARKDETRLYQITQFTSAKEAIEQNLLNYYGGFLKVYRDGFNRLMIDWVENYGVINSGRVEIGENVISQSNRLSGENLFTAIRPVGKDGLVHATTPVIDIYSQEEMAEYGRIVKNVDFPGITNQADLLAAGQALVQRINKTIYKSSEISLLDLHFVDEDEPEVNLGNCYTNIAGFEGDELTVSTRNRDYENPQNDSISLKNAKHLEGNGIDDFRNDGDTISKRTSGSSNGVGMALKYYHELQDEAAIYAQKVNITAEKLLELHADELILSGNNLETLSRRTQTVEGKVTTIEGTGVYQNSDHITQVAGNFTVERDDQGQIIGINVIEGAKFSVEKDGVYSEVVGQNGMNSAIAQTASQIRMEVENSISQVRASIEITEEAIRSDVSAANSTIYTSIEQTASAIRSTIADTENGLYNYIQNTASGTRQIIVSTTNRSWVQDKDPRTEAGGGHETKAGDIWIESTHQGTWDGAEGFDWDHDEQYDWTQIQGAKIWAWKNGKWELAHDGQQVVSYSDVVNTAEHYVNLKIAGLVNDEGLLDVYMSKIEQTATQIRSEISSSDSTIYTFVHQTRSNILMRVAEQPAHVYSKTQPTKIVYGEGDDKTERDPMNGDLWIDSQMTENWDAAFELSWGDEVDIDWNALRSDKIKVYKDGQWVDVVDGTKLVDDADIEVDRNTAKMYARKLEQVNGELQRYYAELKVDAHSIRSQVDEIYNGLGSRITQTAREIRSDVYAANSKVYSAITQTASNIKMEVANAISGVQASLEVTADSIRSDVSAADSQIYSSITQTASSIRLDVTNAISDVRSSITQTANSIRSDVSAANSRIYTSIQQTASSIRMEVNSAVSNYRSLIKQQADRISLVVEGTGSNAKIKPAQIVTAINSQTGTSVIRINANMVYISGTTKIDDIFGVNSNGYLTVRGDIYQNGVIRSTGVSIAEGGSIGFTVGTSPPVAVSLTGADVRYMIKKAQVDGNTLKLWARGDPDNTPSITFSKATSLDGTWSGTVAAGKSYKVTASPQGTIHYSPQLDGIIYRNDKAWANDKKSFTQTLYVYDEDGEELYEENLTFYTTDSYNAGYDANHNLFIGDTNYTAKPSSISLSLGESIEVWPYFKKSDGSTYQWGPKYTISAPSDPHPTRYTLRCTEATPAYPGGSVKNYTFTLQGVYSFGANTNYYFYR